MKKQHKSLLILAILALTAGIVSPKETAFQALQLSSPEAAWKQECQTETFQIALMLEAKNLNWTPEAYLKFAAQIMDLSQLYQIEPALLLAVIEVESQFDPCAVSGKGAKGLMQIRPSLLAGEAHDLESFNFVHHLYFDPSWNLGVGVKYLDQMIQRFGSKEKALSAYNMGPTRLKQIMRKGKFNSSYAQKVMEKETWYSDQISSI